MLIKKQMEKTKKPREKGEFGKITFNENENRFRCNITLKNYDSSSKRWSVASSVGGSREECEQKVVDKILSVFEQNKKAALSNGEELDASYLYVYKALARAETEIESSRVLEKVEKLRNEFFDRLRELHPDKY